MKKRDELLDLNSCLNKATSEELIFVLLGRDIAAPATVLFWARERVRLGKNKVTDPQIAEAVEWAIKVAKAQREIN
jgi:hypothetical protein